MLTVLAYALGYFLIGGLLLVIIEYQERLRAAQSRQRWKHWELWYLGVFLWPFFVVYFPTVFGKYWLDAKLDARVARVTAPDRIRDELTQNNRY